MAEAELELPPRGMITLFRRTLVLDDRGLHLGRKHIAWDDVAFYTYTWEDGVLAGDIYIIARDDRWLRIDDRYHYWRQAADRILAELHPRLRADPDFYPFELTAGELRHARFGALALGEIDRVEIAPSPDGPGLVVHDRRTAGGGDPDGVGGGAGAARRASQRWWSIDALDKVHSPVLLLDCLAARGVAVGATVPLWLPPSAGGLAEQVAGKGELPAAHLVQR